MSVFSNTDSEGCDGAGEAFLGECHRNTAPALEWLQTSLTRMGGKKKKDKNKIGAISFPCSIRTKARLSVAKCALEMRCKVCAYSGFIRRTE